MLLAGSVDGGFGDFLKKLVGLAVKYAIALPDRRLSDSLGQVALAGAGWT